MNSYPMLYGFIIAKEKYHDNIIPYYKKEHLPKMKQNIESAEDDGISVVATVKIKFRHK